MTDELIFRCVLTSAERLQIKESRLRILPSGLPMHFIDGQWRQFNPAIATPHEINLFHLGPYTPRIISPAGDPILVQLARSRGSSDLATLAQGRSFSFRPAGDDLYLRLDDSCDVLASSNADSWVVNGECFACLEFGLSPISAEAIKFPEDRLRLSLLACRDYHA